MTHAELAARLLAQAKVFRANGMIHEAVLVEEAAAALEQREGWVMVPMEPLRYVISDESVNPKDGDDIAAMLRFARDTKTLRDILAAAPAAPKEG